MKKIYLVVLLAALALQSAVAQNNLQHPSVIAKEEGFGYRGLKKLIGMDSVYAGTFFESSYHDFLGILYSQVGRYKVARHEAEAVGTMFVNHKRYAHNYKNAIAIPLSKVMDSIIENNRVIMLNEMHFNPHNRAFEGFGIITLSTLQK